MRRNKYEVVTSTGRRLQCESERSARYIYSCNKHAKLYRNGEIIESK